jgi:hypothetical protein
MHFEERSIGDYLIYAGALEAQGGYVAAVVVSRTKGVNGAPREAFRDTAMSGGHRWPSASAALAFALKHAQEIIRKEPQRLFC